MGYKLLYSRQSEKYLSRLTPSNAKRILKRIESLADYPHKPDSNIAKLVGTVSSFRLRVGDIRVIYFLDEEKQRILITKIAPRGSAYSS